MQGPQTPRPEATERDVDHYELFGIARDASHAELRRAYRRLAARHHPDRNHDDPAAATRRMAEINDAFATLSDPVRKFDYDRRLSRRPAPEGPRTERPASPRRPDERAPRPDRTPEDDPVRRARREAKERAAAEAKARRYRDPGGGFFDGSRYH